MSLAATIDAMIAAGCTPQELCEVVRAHEDEQARIAAEIAAIPVWHKQVAAVFARDGRRCGYCGDEVGPFHVDHVLPRCKGGTNALDNLVVACKPCNLSKKDRPVTEEWLERRRRARSCD